MPERSNFRRGYTLTELLVVMALVAIVVAVVVEWRRIGRSPEFIMAIGMPADGSRVLAVLSDGSVVAWDTATREKSSLTGPWPPGAQGSTRLYFSPDGLSLARVHVAQAGRVVQFDLVLQVVDLQTGAIRDYGSIDISSPLAFSSDGRRIAFADSQNQLRVIHLYDRSVPDVVMGPVDPLGVGIYIGSLAFSPDDEKILFVSGEPAELHSWDLKTKQATRATVAADATQIRMALSPDGTRIAVARVDPKAVGNPPGIVEIYDANNLQLLHQANHGYGGVYSMEFARGGKVLAVLGEDLQIWNIDPLEKLQTLSADFGRGWGGSTATAADRIAVSGLETVYLVEGNRLRLLGSIERSKASIYSLLVAFCIICAAWVTMRRRRKQRANEKIQLTGANS